MMAHGTEYPVLFGQVGSAHLAVSPPGKFLKINPVLAEPRTGFVGYARLLLSFFPPALDSECSKSHASTVCRKIFSLKGN